jgi:hypothetical protein
MKRLLLWVVVGVILLWVILGIVTWLLPAHLRWEFWAAIAILAVLSVGYEFVLCPYLEMKMKKEKEQTEAAKKGFDVIDLVFKASSATLVFFAASVTIFLWQPLPLGPWVPPVGLLLGVVVGSVWSILSQKKKPR